MGLAISIGFLADMKTGDSEGYDWALKVFKRLNDALAKRDLPTWEEPETLEAHPRASCSSFPYGFLHYLRRAYALNDAHPDQSIPPVGPEGLQATDALVADVGCMFDSHLLCHSDAEGFYVPVDFRDPIFADDAEGIPGGGMLGSSHRLLKELRGLALKLGISLDNDGNLSDADALVIHRASDDEAHPLWREHMVWLRLFECARLSVEHNTAIHFS